MKKPFRSVFVAVLFLFLSVVVPCLVTPVNAAFLRFDQTSLNATVNQSVTVQAVVDAGTDQITSTDMWVIYDPAYLEVQSVTDGTFFAATTHNTSAGKVTITGLVTDPGTYKTGTGTVATIVFKALKNGSTTVTYDCRTDASNSSKVIKNDINATNVISCTTNGSLSVTIGGSTSGGATNGGSTGGTTGSTGGSTAGASPSAPTPTQLPRTGFAETARLLAPALFLVLVGGALRLLL